MQKHCSFWHRCNLIHCERVFKIHQLCLGSPRNSAADVLKASVMWMPYIQINPRNHIKATLVLGVCLHLIPFLLYLTPDALFRFTNYIRVCYLHTHVYNSISILYMCV